MSCNDTVTVNETTQTVDVAEVEETVTAGATQTVTVQCGDTTVQIDEIAETVTVDETVETVEINEESVEVVSVGTQGPPGPATSAWKQEVFDIVQTDIDNGYIELEHMPSTDSELVAVNGVVQNSTYDYSIASNRLTWIRPPRLGWVYMVKYQYT